MVFQAEVATAYTRPPPPAISQFITPPSLSRDMLALHGKFVSLRIHLEYFLRIRLPGRVRAVYLVRLRWRSAFHVSYTRVHV